jgi:hypothetical protein
MSSVLEGQCEQPGSVCLTGEAFCSTTAVSRIASRRRCMTIPMSTDTSGVRTLWSCE